MGTTRSQREPNLVNTMDDQTNLQFIELPLLKHIYDQMQHFNEKWFFFRKPGFSTNFFIKLTQNIQKYKVICKVDYFASLKTLSALVYCLRYVIHISISNCFAFTYSEISLMKKTYQDFVRSSDLDIQKLVSNISWDFA